MSFSNDSNRIPYNQSVAVNLTNSQMARLEMMLENFFQESHESVGSKWTMMNSVFFASTVVTTIGDYHIIYNVTRYISMALISTAMRNY